MCSKNSRVAAGGQVPAVSRVKNASQNALRTKLLLRLTMSKPSTSTSNVSNSTDTTIPMVAGNVQSNGTGRAMATAKDLREVGQAI